MQRLEQLMAAKLPAGCYHFAAFFLLVLIDLTDGGNIAIMSVILPNLRREFDLGTGWVSVLTSIYYVGTAIGSVVVGGFSDLHGRRKIVIIGMLMQVVVCVAVGFCRWFWLLVVLRFCFGFAYGFTLPLTTVYITELVPPTNRGKWILFVNFFVTIGKLYGTFLAWLVLDNLQTGDWRKLILWSAAVPCLALILACCILLESLRFSLVAHRLPELARSFNAIADWNNRFPQFSGGVIAQHITTEEVEELAVLQSRHAATTVAVSSSVLWSPKWIRVTLLLWAIYFNLNSMFFGQLALLPFLLSESSSGIAAVFTTILGEVPVVALSYFLIDNPTFGRRRSICIFAVGSLVAHLLPIFSGPALLSLLLFASRFCMKGIFGCVYPLSSEVYPTQFRTIGYGFATGVGRVGACVMPFLVFPLMNINAAADFLFFGLNAAVCAVAAFFFPLDTTGRPLDLHEPLAVELQDTGDESMQLE